MKKSINGILSIVLVLVSGATVFTACGRKHKHAFSEEWKYDEKDIGMPARAKTAKRRVNLPRTFTITTRIRPATCAIM